MSACLDCPRGKYQPFAGSDSCRLCRSGRYQASPGRYRIIATPAELRREHVEETGQGNAHIRTAVCNRCPPGKYRHRFRIEGEWYDTGKLRQSCNFCPTGEYQADYGGSG